VTPCFGIDLGTSCSSIGWVVDGVPRLLSIDGSTLLPSVVWFPEDAEPVVGQAAVNHAALEPDRVVRSAKRRLGTGHTYTIGERTVTPVDVSALVLRALADGAERACGVRPERVVVTVPAWFNQAQRGETRRAVDQAGLELARMINEPTAAGLAHNLGHTTRRRAMVYDLGGGTFDVSIIDQDGPVTQVLASRGDTRLGGDDVDRALVDILLVGLAREDPDLRAATEASPAARVRLQLAVEETKRELSETLFASVRVPFLAEVDGQRRHFEARLDRTDLDNAVDPLLARTLDCVAEAMNDAGLSASDEYDLLLVGGSTRLPQVYDALHELLGAEGSHAIPPREAVALGAAVQAAIVDGQTVHGILIDVAPWPLSVGALAPGNPRDRLECSVITPRNAPLPARHARRVFTVHPMQSKISLPIFQGADRDPRRNTILAEVGMEGLPVSPDDVDQRPIDVEIRHTLDGMVEITVTDELSGRTERVTTALDGEVQASLWDDVVAQARAGGYALGNEDIEPTVDVSGSDSDGPSTAVVAPQGDHEEAQTTFAQVLKRRDELAEEHPEHIDRLVELAERGQRELQTDPTAALATYDELSDQLFAIGQYL